MKKEKELYFYGIDPAMGSTGVSIFNRSGKLVDYFAIETTNKKLFQRDEPFEFGERLNHIYEILVESRKKYPPFEVALERGFTRFNKSTQVIFRAHGVVNLVFHDIPLFYYTPKTVKGAIWKGNASKEEIMSILETRLNVNFEGNDDISDSVAVLITHLTIEHGHEWKHVNRLTAKDRTAETKAEKAKSKTPDKLTSKKPAKKKATPKKQTKLKPLKSRNS